MNASVLVFGAAALVGSGYFFLNTGSAAVAAQGQVSQSAPAPTLTVPAAEAGSTAQSGAAGEKGSTEKGPTVQVDPKIPEYTPVEGVSGTIKSVGSDTMNNMMTLWQE